MKNKWKARQGYNQMMMKEIFWVERTHPKYGFPAVEIASHKYFFTLKEAEEYAKHLNGEVEQIKLF